MMHLSVYNGLKALNNSQACRFDDQISIISENGQINNITLNDNVQELFIPENNYSIRIPSSYKCENQDISFDETIYTFNPPQMVISFFYLPYIMYNLYIIYKM